MSATPVFWIFAVLLIALALALLLPSLLRRRANTPPDAGDARSANLSILRDQLAQLDVELATGNISAGQQAQARSEIERRALEEESTPESSVLKPASTAPSALTAVVVAIGIPLTALGMYGLLGNLQALQPQAVMATAGGEVSAAQIEAMVAQLAERLENPTPGKPVDPKAWEMLARSYAAMQRFPEAAKAYARASQLAPDNAQLLADHADVLAMLQGQSVSGEPTRLIEQALKLDPKNLKALALAGSAAFERQDFATANLYWTKARALAPPGSDFATGLDRSIEEAQVASGAVKSPAAGSSAGKAGDKPAIAPASIQGIVSLAPTLAGKVGPDDTVFIFARASEGPRMPLAILRRKASDLPITFTLDDSTAMSAELKLSKFPLLVVGARISKSGNAMPQSGDLVGQSKAVKAGGDQLGLVIDSIQP